MTKPKTTKMHDTMANAVRGWMTCVWPVRQSTRQMNEPEIILNLWYVFDDRGVIYSLRARTYVQGSSDEEKLRFLQQFAKTDYLIARPFPVPERYHTMVVEGRIKKKMPVMLMQALETQGGSVTAADLFDEAFKEIEKDLPAQTKLSIPDDPLICITGLYADDDGNIHPQIDGQTYVGSS